jgi:hypothetical protein
MFPDSTHMTGNIVGIFTFRRGDSPDALNSKAPSRPDSEQLSEPLGRGGLRCVPRGLGQSRYSLLDRTARRCTWLSTEHGGIPVI